MVQCQQMFSYVVDHDYGFAPNPENGLCSLARCKFGSPGKANLVEKARVGDWILGTIGKRNSQGNSGVLIGGLVYAMKVTEKILLEEYVEKYPSRRDAIFRNGCDQPEFGGRYALLSTVYFYFGCEAISLDELPQYDAHPLFKKGPGYRRDFDESYVQKLEKWLLANYQIGKLGEPCLAISGHETAVTCPTC
ncbi:MAG: hypothetical protein U1C96_10260 [Gallionella sp.]|nr:hypothetical protein [Gallionella sp.]